MRGGGEHVAGHLAGGVGPAPAPPRSQVSIKTAATVAATVLGVACAAWFVWATTGALVLTLVALLLAVALDRVVAWLEGRGMRRGLGIALVVLALLVVTAGVGLLFVPKLVAQATALVQAAPELAARFQRSAAYRALQRHVDVGAVLAHLRSRAPSVAAEVVSPALEAVRWAVEAVAAAVTILFVTIFMLAAGRPLLENLLAQARPERRAEYRALLHDVYRALSGYVAGHLAILSIQGIATAVALAVAGVPYFLPLGMLSGAASLVPFLGVTAMGTAMAIVAWATNGLWAGVGVAIYYVVYQQFENHVLYPLVYRHTVHVNPLVIILAVLFLGELAGIPGAILAVPAAAAGHIVLAELLRWRRRRLGIAG